MGHIIIYIFIITYSPDLFPDTIGLQSLHDPFKLFLELGIVRFLSSEIGYKPFL